MGDINYVPGGMRFFHLSAKKSSPTMSTFAPSKILPEEFPALDEDPVEDLEVLRSPMGDRMSPQVLDRKLERPHPVDSAQNSAQEELTNDEPSPYDLAPPPPTVSHTNAEILAERLFSSDHLRLILQDQSLFHRFTNYLNRYRPSAAPTLVKYLESQKAISAIRYANALAEESGSQHAHQSSANTAATIDPKFESWSRRALDDLVNDALPNYITYWIVNVVTECLVKEITGSNAPVMRDLVQGLAEVYCMTDPSLPDNPIVFASDEFYNTTQYGREYVIGKNCRFLQGPRTSSVAITRVSDALRNGREICEILLNYRRDGSPFLNLVMMAPLYDNHGNVRYFIGCQLDVNNLIDDGRGLESFQRLLIKDRSSHEKPLPDPLAHKASLQALADLGQNMNNEEIEAIQQRARRGSMESGRSTPTRPAMTRRFVGMDDPMDTSFWPPSQFGSSGRLPGVYQNYLLVRPYPSLRIIFTSASLRIPGLSQSKFLDRIGGSQHVREGITDALAAGVGVTAKVSWLTQVGSSANDDDNGTSLEGKPRWIHCTPLLGSDSKVGVWMVVMVEKEEVTGALNSRSHSQSSKNSAYHGRYDAREGWPLRGQGGSAASARFTSAKLYADYLRREGKLETSDGPRSRESKSRTSEGGRRSVSVRGRGTPDEGR